jgi:hypothetical protein
MPLLLPLYCKSKSTINLFSGALSFANKALFAMGYGMPMNRPFCLLSVFKPISYYLIAFELGYLRTVQ